VILLQRRDHLSEHPRQKGLTTPKSEVFTRDGRDDTKEVPGEYDGSETALAE
jgi:hypothetical protein